MKKTYHNLLIVLAILIVAGPNCVDKNEDEFSEVNEWIRSEMEENYLWNERVPSEASGVIPPNAFFGSMLDAEDDVSYITRTPGAVNENELTLSSGISAAFGRFVNSSGVFAVVEFVYPGSPAEISGIKRGDIILAVDGFLLNTSNFISLFFQDTPRVTYSFGVYNSIENTVEDINEQITVNQTSEEFNPIVYSSVIDTANTKIGYLLYGRFENGNQNQFRDSLLVEFQRMKNEGVQEVILDLRYNREGSFENAKLLANTMVNPEAALNEELFLSFEYNEIITDAITTRNGADSDSLAINFETISENLGLTRIYVLTTSVTQAVSEGLIAGLSPHMQVVLIGEATGGVFFDTKLISGKNARVPNDYFLIAVYSRFSNLNGNITTEGLEPDINVPERILEMRPLGDFSDPAISEAINSITGSESGVTAPAFYNYQRVKKSISY